MKLLKKLIQVLLFSSALSSCGDIQFGVPMMPINDVNGVYICYGDTLDTRCRPAEVFACNLSNSSKTANVESYYSFMPEEKIRSTVTVPANTKAGFGSRLGTSEHMANGLCKTRNYRVDSAN